MMGSEPSLLPNFPSVEAKSIAAPGFEPGSPDSESGVITTTLRSTRKATLVHGADPLLLQHRLKVRH